MIPEYNMRSAIPINGGERVVGYLTQHLIDGDLTKTKTRSFIQWDTMDEIGKVYLNKCEVDSDTIELIKAKPITQRWNGIEGRPYKLCPNCNGLLGDGIGLSELDIFCPNCGIAINWEESMNEN